MAEARIDVETLEQLVISLMPVHPDDVTITDLALHMNVSRNLIYRARRKGYYTLDAADRVLLHNGRHLCEVLPC
jgi:hypothetical protein